MTVFFLLFAGLCNFLRFMKPEVVVKRIKILLK